MYLIKTYEFDLYLILFLVWFEKKDKDIFVSLLALLLVFIRLKIGDDVCIEFV